MKQSGAASLRRRSLGFGVTAFGLAAGGKLLPARATSATDERRAKRTLYVGPAREIKTLRQAAKLARDHDLVLVDPGEYPADAIVEDIEFRGSRSSDRNGAGGYRWEQNELLMSFSTVVNDGRWWGTFVRVSAGPAKAELLDNLMAGPGRMDLRVSDPTVRNSDAKAEDFADVARFDWRLRRTSRLVGAAGIAGTGLQGRARPEREYVHPASSAVLEGYSAMSPLSPGALQRLAP